MLFSCLVDADFLDTEAHFDGRRAGSRGGYPRPADLLGMFDAHMAKFGGRRQGQRGAPARAGRLPRRRAGRARRGVFTLTGPTGLRQDARRAWASPWNTPSPTGSTGSSWSSRTRRSSTRTRRSTETCSGHQNVIDHHASLDPKKETGRNRTACENWDAPVIVTTSVQFVESLFANKTSRCRKLHNVVNSVVIFDEVQTLPIGHLAPDPRRAEGVGGELQGEPGPLDGHAAGAEVQAIADVRFREGDRDRLRRAGDVRRL